MSDEETATVEETPAATPEATEEPRNEDEPLGEAGQKALDAFKSRAKEAEKRAKEAESKLQEREDAEKSELERAQGKLTKTEQELAEARTILLRNEVADEMEVPSKLRPLLTAASKEELEAQANLILENAAKPEEPKFDGGARDPSPDPKTPEDALRELVTGLLGARQT